MELNEVLQQRRSIRKFLSKNVEEDKISQLLHAGMSGPSACNKKPWAFYVVLNEEVLNKLMFSGRFTKIKAPLAIVVCGDLTHALPSPFDKYWIHDCAAASENILLEAVNLGLGAVWCGVHVQQDVEENVSKILALPEKHIPLNIIYIGYPDETREARDQYNDKYVHYIK